MRNILNRFLLVIAGLLLTWFSTEVGDKMFHSVLNIKLSLVKFEATGLFIILCLAALVFSVYECLAFMDTFHEKDEAGHFNHVSDIFEASLSSASVAFVFGAFVDPIGKSGIEAWTPWDFLFILGLMPMTLIVKDIVIDLVSIAFARPED